jgi:hypothetical protein
MPYATAFTAMLLDAVCAESGTEMAHWLFWQKNTAGTFQTAAKFIAAWKSPLTCRRRRCSPRTRCRA